MKTRLDFVTNSSSSSFIMAFKSKDTVMHEMVENTKEQYSPDSVDVIAKAMYVANDIENNGKPESSDTIIERICSDYKEDLIADATYEQFWHQENTYSTVDKKTGVHKNIQPKSYWDCKEETMANSSIMYEIDKKVDELRSKLTAKTTGKDFFVEMQYGDEDGEFFSEIEHEILPYHHNTIHVISHH